jgi:hypothetical protein
MPPDGESGLDEVRDAFAQEIPGATRQRDQSGRFVSTAKAEPIFQERSVEGDDRGDTSDGGADPRFLEQERRVADGRSEEGSAPPKRVPAADGESEAEPDLPERIGEEPDADPDADKKPGEEEDASPRYKVQVDGQELEVSLNEALRGYVREETFNHRMNRMVEIAKQVDARAAEAQAARDGYIQLCHNQEQEFAALIPPEPNWDQLFATNPQGAHQLQKNYQHVYGTINTIRQRRAQAQQEAMNDHAQRTAGYARAEFDKFKAKNKLTDQQSVDKALQYMRATALELGFNDDEIGTTYDERMLTALHWAAKFRNMMRNKPLPVQPDKGVALAPGSAQRIGNGAARGMNDAQRRLAATGRVDDAALVMAQLIRR